MSKSKSNKTVILQLSGGQGPKSSTTASSSKEKLPKLESKKTIKPTAKFTSIKPVANKDAPCGQSFNIKEHIIMREHLGFDLSEDVYWYVKDVHQDLVLLGVDQELVCSSDDLYEKFGHLAGSIYDLYTGQLVSRWMGTVKKLVLDSNLQEVEDNLSFLAWRPKNDVVEPTLDHYSFPIEDCKIWIGSEQALIRVFQHDNKIFFVVNNCLNGYNSMINLVSVYKTFVQLYDPSCEDHTKFDLSKLFKDCDVDIIHHFVLYHPSIHSVNNYVCSKLEYHYYTPVNQGKKNRLPFCDDDMISEYLNPNVNVCQGLTLRHPVGIHCANTLLYPEFYAPTTEEIMYDASRCLPDQLIPDYHEDGYIEEFIYHPDDSISEEFGHFNAGDYVYVQYKDQIFKLESSAYYFRSCNYDTNSSPNSNMFASFHGMDGCNFQSQNYDEYLEYIKEKATYLRMSASSQTKQLFSVDSLTDYYQQSRADIHLFLNKHFKNFTLLKKDQLINDKIMFDDQMILLNNLGKTTNYDALKISEYLDRLNYKDYKKIHQATQRYFAMSGCKKN